MSPTAATVTPVRTQVVKRFIMRFVPALRFFQRRAEPIERVDDPADMGTAFGLEARLQEPVARSDFGPLESQRPHPPLDNPMAWMRGRRA